MHRVAVDRDALQVTVERPDIHDHTRRDQPEPHEWDQALASGQQLGLVAVLSQRGECLVGRTGPDVVECSRNHDAPPVASSMARRTFFGEAGMVTSVTPIGRSASTTAFITAGVEVMVPASPMPFTPSGLVGGRRHRVRSSS